MKYKIEYKSTDGADFVANGYQFYNNTLRDAVQLWYDNEELARTKYGDINTWDVSQVNNMFKLFFEKENFNSNIGNWDTSKVNNMSYMFSGANSFNQDISNWNTFRVTNMEEMFSRANSFNNGATNEDPNHSLLTRDNAWNTSNVTNMMGMFNEAISFNQDISNWNTSRVTNMQAMFRHANAFNNGATIDDPNHPLLTNDNVWNTSNVTNMVAMFCYASSFNQDISNWNTSMVNNMSYMFWGASSFNNGATNNDINHPLLRNGDAWNTFMVTNMSGMFMDAISFNQPIDNWDVSSVTDMHEMFRRASSFNQDISNWNTSRVTNMSRMFIDATAFNQNIGYWIIDDNCNMQNMFSNSGITRETFEGKVYGQKIANYFNPPLPNPKTNEELIPLSPRRRIQDKSRVAIVGKTLSEDYITDENGKQIFFRPIPKIIKNPDFPVISDVNREQLRTRLDEINNRNDNDYTEDKNRDFNLHNNQFTDDNGRNFYLFIIVDGNRHMLFEFDNDNLIVKKPSPYLSNDLIQNIGTFIGGK